MSSGPRDAHFMMLRRLWLEKAATAASIAEVIDEPS
jgi:hypothetical protein